LKKFALQSLKGLENKELVVRAAYAWLELTLCVPLTQFCLRQEALKIEACIYAHGLSDEVLAEMKTDLGTRNKAFTAFAEAGIWKKTKEEWTALLGYSDEEAENSLATDLRSAWGSFVTKAKTALKSKPTGLGTPD
jgi:hypothetical protein